MCRLFKNISCTKIHLITILSFQLQEYATCDPEYYKWTQFIFLKMFEAGLVEQREV